MNKTVIDFLKKSICVLMLSCTLGMMFGCNRDGPAEKAGEEVDKTVEGAGEKATEPNK